MPQLDPRRNSEFADMIEGGNFIAPSGIDESIHKEKNENKLIAVLRKGWLRLPKSVRGMSGVLVCLLLLATVVLYVCWLMLPQIDPERAFRLEEKRILKGPSEILETVLLEGEYYDRVILAEDVDGIAVYGYNSTNVTNEEKFAYYEKTGDITLVRLPLRYSGSYGIYPLKAAVAVFDNYPDAVRAQLDMTRCADAPLVNDGEYEDTWTCILEAERRNNRYFLFELNSGEDDGTPEWEWKTSCLYEFFDGGDHQYPATLRLYDAEGNLVLEKNVR